MRTFFKPLLLLAAIIFCLSIVSDFKVSAAGDLFCAKRAEDGSCQEGTCHQAPDSAVCQASKTSRDDNQNNNVVLKTINTASNIIALVAGLVAVIMIIIAGFTYATAGGNAEGTKNARNRIIYAAVGLVIIASAWSITRFVLDKVL
jgi:hypothetical protein